MSNYGDYVTGNSLIRKPICTRVPTIKRTPVVSRNPVVSESISFEGCILCNDGLGCNGVRYCSAFTTRQDNPSDFRLIRVLGMEHSEEYWSRVIESIEFVKQQGCNIRVVTDSPIPRRVLFALNYSPYNVVQYNVNLIDKFNSLVRKSILTSVNCGLFTTLMLYPIIPSVTRTYDIIELLSSLQYSCKVVCFKFLELDYDLEEFSGFYNINGNMVSSKYMERDNGKLVCSDYFKENFCTIMTTYLEPRKVSCSLCNDKICY